MKEIAFDPLNPSRISLVSEGGELYLYKIERCGHMFSKLTRIVIGKDLYSISSNNSRAVIFRPVIRTILDLGAFL